MSETVIGEYMVATEDSDLGFKTRRWTITSRSGDSLGWVRWCGAWRQYIFSAAAGSEFSAGCLHAMVAFLEARTTEQLAAAKAKARA